MGHRREQTAHLAEKLKQIREQLKLSQDGIIKQLELEDKLTREDISKFERGVREPPLYVILRYARAIELSTDILIDDSMYLPDIKDFR